MYLENFFQTDNIYLKIICALQCVCVCASVFVSACLYVLFNVQMESSDGNMFRCNSVVEASTFTQSLMAQIAPP